MNAPLFPPARDAATRVYPHFARHHAAAGDFAPLPDLETMQSLIAASFWASLRREEGYVPKISMAYLPPEQAGQSLTLENALPVDPHSLARLGPAVEDPGIHLGIWRAAGELSVWGALRKLPPLCFVVEVVAPGLLVIKHSRGEDAAKFTNVAVLEGEQIKVLDQRAAALPDCPSLLSSLLGFDTPAAPGSVNLLVRLAVAMRAHGRGGSLLVVPAGSEAWRESIRQPILYSVAPPFAGAAELSRADATRQRDLAWQMAVRRAVDGLAGLTAVDGATIINDAYELLAFGAKIGRRDGCARVEQLIVTEPVEGSEATMAQPTAVGGTRHMSAAQFAHDQRDSIALVASQDGRFTVFAWSACAGVVHAHRIETLLL